jgi:MOB kinase activator 1
MSAAPKKGGTLITHATGKRLTLSNKAKFTLGQGNLRAAVRLPDSEDLNEWLASNIVDFFNEVSLLYGLCADDALRFTKPGEGFPPGFQYLWMDGVVIKTPIKCSSPEYVDYVMTWIEDQINNESIFPVSPTAPFPDDFQEVYVVTIFKRLFRVFAIIYQCHFQAIEKVDAVGHLNTCFKHFVFFLLEFDLLDEKESKALEGPVQRLQAEFQKS